MLLWKRLVYAVVATAQKFNTEEIFTFSLFSSDFRQNINMRLSAEEKQRLVSRLLATFEDEQSQELLGLMPEDLVIPETDPDENLLRKAGTFLEMELISD
jgi:hypothetical protein